MFRLRYFVDLPDILDRDPGVQVDVGQALVLGKRCPGVESVPGETLLHFHIWTGGRAHCGQAAAALTHFDQILKLINNVSPVTIRYLLMTLCSVIIIIMPLPALSKECTRHSLSKFPHKLPLIFSCKKVEMSS